jgi:DNA recombination protein RmuC
VVDAKAPLQAYLDALEATDDVVRAAKIADHARQIRDHITKLSGKAYWAQLDTPEFVVLFIPGEAFYSAALEQDPSLIEIGINQKVILATPTTLIALLRTVAYGWRQEALADDARHIAALGKDLYDRLQKMAEHWVKMGKGLNGALTAYNEAVGSLETRLMPAARRFRDLKVGAEGDEIREIPPIETLPRPIQAEDLQLPMLPAEPPAGDKH